MSGAEWPVLDTDMIAELRQLGGSDDSFFTDLFAEYLEQAERILDTLHAALSAGDRVSFSRAAHSLAGSSLNVGAAGLGRVCRAVEQAMRSETALPSSMHVQAIETELQRAIAAISSQTAV